MSGPRPGRPVRGSRTGRPIMAALDLLGRRWTLRILWELRDGQAFSFRELRERCDQMSTSVLNQRLHELRDAGIIEISAGGYSLTKRGTELIDALAPLDAWAKQWSRAQRPQGRGPGREPAGEGVERKSGEAAERPPPRRAQTSA